MSSEAMVFFEGRAEDRIVAGLVIVLCYLILFPSYILTTRAISKYRIKKKLVTSQYKLPIHLSPAEFSYIFSAKVDKRHIFATLLDLANRSLITIQDKEGQLYVSAGPRIDDHLLDHEKLIVAELDDGKDRKINFFTEGKSSYKNLEGEKISATKVYIFWWVLRNQMQKNRIINSNMKYKYLKMIFTYGVLISYTISILSVIAITFVRMSRVGEIEASQVVESVVDIGRFLLLFTLPIMVTTFFLLKMRGKNLGRYWLIQTKNVRYLPQIVAYREFVVLTHANKLKFESSNLKSKAIAETRPYAVALGKVEL